MEIGKFIKLLALAHKREAKVKITMLSGIVYSGVIDIEDYVRLCKEDYKMRKTFIYAITDNDRNGDVTLKKVSDLKTEIYFNVVDVSEVQLSEYSFIDESDKYVRVKKEYSSDVVPFVPICPGL